MTIYFLKSLSLQNHHSLRLVILTVTINLLSYISLYCNRSKLIGKSNNSGSSSIRDEEIYNSNKYKLLQFLSYILFLFYFSFLFFFYFILVFIFIFLYFRLRQRV